MIRPARLAGLLVALLAVAPPPPGPAAAQTVAEAPGEARIRALARTLRCPVCQSESILESRSSTAREMMAMVREMVAGGRSDAEITEFFRVRYGDFVLLAPPPTGAGRLVWALPLLLLAGGGGVFALALRRRAPAAAPSPGRPAMDADRLGETEL